MPHIVHTEDKHTIKTPLYYFRLQQYCQYHHVGFPLRSRYAQKPYNGKIARNNADCLFC